MVRKMIHALAPAAPYALTLGGFGCIAAAAFVLNVALGLAVTGVSLLLIEHGAGE